MAAAERFSFFYPSNFWQNRRRKSGYRYEQLVEEDNDELSPPQDIMVSQPSRTPSGGDAGLMAKRVLRKIDMRLIPLLFITYGLNFMDKTILSSASVFGLKDDTVRPYLSLLGLFASVGFELTAAYSISRGKTTAGCLRSSILDILHGHIPPPSSSPGSPWPGT